MSNPPKWPFRCPRDGWYLTDVGAIFSEEVQHQVRDTGDPHMPLLVYGTCKRHGRVWLSSLSAYDPEVWRKEYELRQVEWTQRPASV